MGEAKRTAGYQQSVMNKAVLICIIRAAAMVGSLGVDPELASDLLIKELAGMDKDQTMAFMQDPLAWATNAAQEWKEASL